MESPDYPACAEAASDKAAVRAQIAAAMPPGWRVAARPAPLRSLGDVRAELAEIGQVRRLMRRLRLPAGARAGGIS